MVKGGGVQLPVTAVNPSQLYLSSEKLDGVLSWFDFDEPNYGSLPVFSYEDDWYLADGHTRAFTATLAGAETITVRREPIREEYDFNVYRRSIEWCAEAGIDGITDLHGRVVSPERYEELWIDRCQRVAEEGGDEGTSSE